MWEDLIFSVGQLAFVIALLPSIFGSDKPALSTSLMYGSILLVFAGAYASLELWGSTITAAAISIAWFILVVQKFLGNRRKSARKNAHL
ncbi:MAG: hypothetical protein WD175_02700 [Candidatus Paceibacterota bacterium]